MVGLGVLWRGRVAILTRGKRLTIVWNGGGLD